MTVIAAIDRNTREALRSKAEHVESLVELGTDEQPAAAEKLKARRERRQEWYRRLENAVLDLANVLPAGTEDFGARQLFRFLIELRRAIEADLKAADEDGRVRLAAMKMADVARRIERRLAHAVLDDSEEAARYVFDHLGALTATELSRLLGVSTKTVAAWKAGQAPVRQGAERVKLVAQLVSYLRHSMTQTGVTMWFENPSDHLDGESPLERMDRSVSAAWQPLISLARGGRGQLAD
jgi:DNA-binding transcriptional regulator YiaG